ncbi:MAG TPA: c-type cytochrome [Blastocatellia bacterium]|nr:c-type cytochrome [Blastocatellia bacterium]
MARRRWKRIVGTTLLIILVLIIVGITFTIGWRPFIGPKTRALTDRTIEATPARLERGKYMVNAVYGCLACHSERDPKVPGMPALPDKLGAGTVFGEGNELPGRIIAPNLTPDKETGIGNWTDDTLARAIREGIGHDGRALFPLMPYQNYRAMPDEDLASVIAYLRTLAPVRNPLPQTEIIFPVKYLIRSAPQPITESVPGPDMSTPEKRGEFLVRMSSCADCHTPQDRGQVKPGFEFAGGLLFTTPEATVMAANITPDPSGISYYDEDLFIQAIRTGKVKARSLSPVMPWVFYRNMTDQDLKDVFAYLKTLKPVKHTVDNTEQPTKCKLCGIEHGGGNKN